MKNKASVHRHYVQIARIGEDTRHDYVSESELKLALKRSPERIELCRDFNFMEALGYVDSLIYLDGRVHGWATIFGQDKDIMDDNVIRCGYIVLNEERVGRVSVLKDITILHCGLINKVLDVEKEVI